MDKEGNLWFGSTGEGIYRYDGKFFTQFTTKDGLTSNTIYSMLEDNEGNIWIGTDNGLCRYEGKKIINVSLINLNNILLKSLPKDPLAKNEVWSIMQSKNGTIWFGTREGLYCYDGKFFNRFLDKNNILNKDSLQLKMIDCMLEDETGIIWLGSGMIPGDEGICRYDPASGILTSFKPNGDGWIRYMLKDKKGNIWIGCRHEGIWLYDGKIFTRFMEGLDIGLSALADKQGNVWFSGGEESDGYSSDGSLWLYDGKSLKKISRNNLDNYGVWSMIEDNAGNIWFGTRNNGLYRFDRKTFTRFSE